MKVRSLKQFQSEAVRSGVAIFTHAKSMLDAIPADDAASRALVVNGNGYLLLEAPTGTGKTLIAGHIAQEFSAIERVVWFWFAPFKGVVEQSIDTLRGEFPALRLRDLASDRKLDGTQPGNVWVTTWQSVATQVVDRRSVRQGGDTNLSVDELIVRLRGEGFRIGAVVDEAHHTLKAKSQAGAFFSRCAGTGLHGAGDGDAG
jgi:type III restriction enzyme